MLSHGSNASARLHRAKSSSSTRPRHPTSSESSTAYVEEAHYEALAAASHAFGQAHERVSLLQNTQHHLHCHSESSETMEDGGLQLGRQRSVRFSGPTAVTANARSITRRQPPAELNPKIYSQARKPPCRNDQVQSIEDYVTALPEAEESDIVTVQSSYRKLKKSKSLWSITKTSQWVSVFCFFGVYFLLKIISHFNHRITTTGDAEAWIRVLVVLYPQHLRSVRNMPNRTQQSDWPVISLLKKSSSNVFGRSHLSCP